MLEHVLTIEERRWFVLMHDGRVIRQVLLNDVQLLHRHLTSGDSQLFGFFMGILSFWRCARAQYLITCILIINIYIYITTDFVP